MKSIQVILIVLSMLAAILGSMAFRSTLISRLLALVFFLAAAGFVIVPNTSSDIARFLGVGRGTDLLLYLVIFAGLHACLLLYIRARRIERKMTELVRALAIQNASAPNPIHKGSGR